MSKFLSVRAIFTLLLVYCLLVKRTYTCEWISRYALAMTPVTMTPSQSVVDGRWAGKPNKEKRKDISEITMSNDPPMSFATDTRKSNVKSRVPTMCLSGASELRIPRLDLTQTHRSPINAGLTGLTSFFFFLFEISIDIFSPDGLELPPYPAPTRRHTKANGLARPLHPRTHLRPCV